MCKSAAEGAFTRDDFCSICLHQCCRDPNRHRRGVAIDISRDTKSGRVNTLFTTALQVCTLCYFRYNMRDRRRVDETRYTDTWLAMFDNVQKSTAIRRKQTRTQLAI